MSTIWKFIPQNKNNCIERKINCKNKAIFSNKLFEQVKNIYDLGYSIGSDRDNSVNMKLSRFKQFCGTINHSLLGKWQKANLTEICRAVSTHMLLCRSELKKLVPCRWQKCISLEWFHNQDHGL